MDVVALAQHGIDHAVATLGTSTTPEHLEQIFRAVPEVVFCFDGDAAGKRASWRALETALPLMQDGRTASFLFLPQGHDPDSLVRAEGRGAFEDRERLMGLSSLLFQELATQTDLRTLEGRARLAALARPLIGQVPAGTFRQLLQERLAELAQTRVSMPAAPRPQTPAAAAIQTTAQRPGRSVMPVLNKALSLLLRDPGLAAESGDFPALDVTADPRLALLVELLELLRAEPALSAGALFERFRETPQGELMDEILAPPLVLEPTLWAAEFAGALKQIQRLSQRNYFSRLVETSAAATPADLADSTRERLRHSPDRPLR
jgi:DNA primase